MSASQIPTAYTQSLRKSFLLGTSAMALFAGTIGLWAATSPIAGAVVAPGLFVVDSNLKKIQHQTGGVVSHLRVKEGDHVTKGATIGTVGGSWEGGPSGVRFGHYVNGKPVDPLRDTPASPNAPIGKPRLSRAAPKKKR